MTCTASNWPLTLLCAKTTRSQTPAGSDVDALKSRSGRVNITNLQTLQNRRDVLVRFHAAYKETIEWMYSDPAALKTYAEFVGIPVEMAKRTRDQFFPKAAVDPDRVVGLEQIVKDAVDLKFTATQLTPEQLTTLIQIPPR